MIAKKITGGLYTGITVLLSASLLFSYKLNSICIIALCLVWLLEGGFRSKFLRISRQPFFIFSALLFLLYLVSIAVSDDKHTARFFVEKNLSLLILPLVLLSKPDFTRQELGLLLRVFVYGTLLLMCVATVIAISRYTGDYHVFFYHRLASGAGISAIIASFLCCLSLAMLLYLPEKKIVKRIAAVALLCWLLLLSSKLFLLIALLIVMINIWPGLCIKKKTGIVVSLAIICLCIGLTHNPVRDRFRDIGKFRSAYLTAASYDPGIYFDGLSLRLVFLRLGVEIMNEDGNYLTGTGSGDAEALLQAKIKDYRMYQGDGIHDKEGYLQYGYHNEYLQKLVQLGIPGLILLLCLLVYGCCMAVKYRNRLLLCILLIFTLSCCTDTLLEQQVGLVSFLLFCCLLLAQIRGEQKQAPGG